MKTLELNQLEKFNGGGCVSQETAILIYAAAIIANTLNPFLDINVNVEICKGGN